MEIKHEIKYNLINGEQLCIYSTMEGTYGAELKNKNTNLVNSAIIDRNFKPVYFWIKERVSKEIWNEPIEVFKGLF